MKDAIDTIREYLKDNKMSYQQLSELSHIPLSTIRKILCRQTKNPRIDTIQAMLDAIGKQQDTRFVPMTADGIENMYQKLVALGFNISYEEFLNCFTYIER